MRGDASVYPFLFKRNRCWKYAISRYRIYACPNEWFLRIRITATLRQATFQTMPYGNIARMPLDPWGPLGSMVLWISGFPTSIQSAQPSHDLGTLDLHEAKKQKIMSHTYISICCCFIEAGCASAIVPRCLSHRNKC